MLDPQFFPFTHLIYHTSNDLPYIQISLNKLTIQYFLHLQTEETKDNLCVVAISCSEASYCLFTNFIAPWLRKVRFIVAYLLACEFMSIQL